MTDHDYRDFFFNLLFAVVRFLWLIRFQQNDAFVELSALVSEKRKCLKTLLQPAKV